MDVDVKMEIQVVLEMLNKVLVENGVSMATTMNGDLCFFDMETYLEKSKFDGFKVNIKELVKLGVNMTESDLIRREDVIKLVNQFVFGLCKAQNDEVIKIFSKHIEKIPTAYNVDEVVEQLKESDQCVCLSNDELEVYKFAINDAIKIVKENYRMEALERLEQLKAGENND